MSFEARFDLPNFDDLDTHRVFCDNCPHRFGRCDQAGYCIVEDSQ